MNNTQDTPGPWKWDWTFGYEAGSKEMLDRVRASLEDYPNAGGDVIVMQHVGRIVKEAVQRCMLIASECEDDDKTAGAVYMAIKERVLITLDKQQKES